MGDVEKTALYCPAVLNPYALYQRRFCIPLSACGLRRFLRNRFMQLTQQAGFEIIDTAPLFRDYLHTTGLSLNVDPFDKHWNREANRLAAEAVALKLNARKAFDAPP